MTEPPGEDASARLLAALARVEERERALEAQHRQIVAASTHSNADDEHDPEGATIAWEREQVRALLGQARAAARDLEQALDRVAAGTYGICESCGGGIPLERLEARPGATRCTGCS
jgi:RNA polymerase-binding transcription factor DksA